MATPLPALVLDLVLGLRRQSEQEAQALLQGSLRVLEAERRRARALAESLSAAEPQPLEISTAAVPVLVLQQAELLASERRAAQARLREELAKSERRCADLLQKVRQERAQLAACIQRREAAEHHEAQEARDRQRRRQRRVEAQAEELVGRGPATPQRSGPR